MKTSLTSVAWVYREGNRLGSSRLGSVLLGCVGWLLGGGQRASATVPAVLLMNATLYMCGNDSKLSDPLDRSLTLSNLLTFNSF
ncbi:hypothetical protein J6590_068551 [Homalodisca vitripennis]|nr:hypothetical protein J6590_068551 [Homalodisca vitripennis]